MIQESADLRATLSLARACALLDLNRGSYYRPTVSVPAAEADAALQAAIEAVVLTAPTYGYRRVTAQLQREGWTVNHKRVRRVMRAAGLLAVPRPRRVRTTQSDHGLPIYPNLLPQCGWRQVTGPNQVWVADLTYIRLRDGFCYLAVVLDVYARRIVGWCLSQRLDTQVALSALAMALAQRQPAPGWIHHSDRGGQYASRKYVACLQAAGARISMTAVGEPRENAPAERFMRTVKEEEVNLHDYGSFTEAARSLGQFIEAVYNQRRLHSALGYRPPSEFEELYAAALLN